MPDKRLVSYLKKDEVAVLLIGYTTDEPDSEISVTDAFEYCEINRFMPPVKVRDGVVDEEKYEPFDIDEEILETMYSEALTRFEESKEKEPKKKGLVSLISSLF